jgi:hypothetical protein
MKKSTYKNNESVSSDSETEIVLVKRKEIISDLN